MVEAFEKSSHFEWLREEKLKFVTISEFPVKVVKTFNSNFYSKLLLKNHSEPFKI